MRYEYIHIAHIDKLKFYINMVIYLYIYIIIIIYYYYYMIIKYKNNII